MKATLTFLGTTSGIPTKERAHTSNLLEYKSHTLLIDCGENCQRQMILARKNSQKIDFILITHWHIDHYAGLFPLISSLGLNKRERPLFLFSPRPLENFIRDQLTYFSRKYPWFKFKYIEDVGPVFGDNEIDIFCEKVEHEVPALAYKILLKFPIKIKVEELEKKGVPKGPLWGKLQAGQDIEYNKKIIKAKDVIYQKKPFSIVFSGDTKACQRLTSFSKDADVAVFDSTYLKKDSVLAKDRFHMTAEDAATVAKKANIKQLILTHFSPRHLDTRLFENEAKKIYKKVQIAKDLKSIEFDL